MKFQYKIKEKEEKKRKMVMIADLDGSELFTWLASTLRLSIIKKVNTIKILALIISDARKDMRIIGIL